MRLRFIFLFIFCVPAFAASINGRQQMDLSGEWQFQFDPDSRGESECWQLPGYRGEWLALAVPGTFNTPVLGRESYEGKGWYRRTFEVPASWKNQKVYVRFLGVALRCKVWLNGQLVGTHLFGHTGFEWDITSSIRWRGPNTLVVLADNRILEKAIPDKKWVAWWNYGGIHREVLLEARPPLEFRQLRWIARRVSSSEWVLQIDARIGKSGKPWAGTVELQLADKAGRKIWFQREPVKSQRDLDKKWVAHLKDIEAWTPDSPNLYTLVLQLSESKDLADRRQIKIGFRQLEARGSRLFLNGEPFYAKGMARHEMYMQDGFAVAAARTRQDFEEIKALGCNFVRLAHYPQHPRVYDLCDELGLLVWDEIPAWMTESNTLLDPEVWNSYVTPQLREMIEQDGIHPCVAVWSVANEIDSDTESGAEYVRRATSWVRQFDPSRLVSFASFRYERETDLDAVDIIGINAYHGWYHSTIHDSGPALDRLHKKWPNKPILVTEIGAGCTLGRHNPKPLDMGWDYSEEYQVKFLTTHLKQIFAPERRDFCAGVVIWVYADFRDPHMLNRWHHPPEQKFINNKGLVTEDRRPKPSYFAVQQFFRHLDRAE
jgi:beta-glucuronidase